MKKIDARKNALSLRKNLDTAKISKKVLEDIFNSKILDRFENVGIYYPLGNEIDITGLLDLYPNKKFYLPVTKDNIHFVCYDKSTILADGPFKTKEPSGVEVDRDIIECFIIPCVCISKDNKRVGYGKGYYDRYLNGYNGYKIGICYKDSNDLDIDMDTFDVSLNMKFVG